jgi:serine/threonine protein kinase
MNNNSEPDNVPIKDPNGLGGFGCVYYTPALPCKKKSNTRRIKNSLHNNNFGRTVSKLLSGKEAAQELMLAEKLRPLDPEFKYFLYPSETCEPRKSNMNHCAEKGPDIYNSQAEEPAPTPKLVFSPYGGKPFDKFVVDFNTIKPFLKSITNLFEGLIILYENQYLHCDIKGDNILVLEQNGEYILRYIDFGLSGSLADLQLEPGNSIGQPHQPIEVQIFSPLTAKIIKTNYEEFETTKHLEFKLDKTKPKDQIMSILKNRKRRQNIVDNYLKIGPPFYFVNYQRKPTYTLFDDVMFSSINMKDMYKSNIINLPGFMFDNYLKEHEPIDIPYSTLEQWNKVSHLVWTQKGYWDFIMRNKEQTLLKLDIYSFANLLHIKWISITGHINTGKNEVSLERGLKIEEEDLEAQEDFATNVSLPFFELLEQMWNPYPADRLTPAAALVKYNKFLTIIDNYDMTKMKKPSGDKGVTFPSIIIPIEAREKQKLDREKETREKEEAEAKRRAAAVEAEAEAAKAKAKAKAKGLGWGIRNRLNAIGLPGLAKLGNNVARKIFTQRKRKHMRKTRKHRA